MRSHRTPMLPRKSIRHFSRPVLPEVLVARILSSLRRPLWAGHRLKQVHRETKNQIKRLMNYEYIYYVICDIFNFQSNQTQTLKLLNSLFENIDMKSEFSMTNWFFVTDFIIQNFRAEYDLRNWELCLNVQNLGNIN